MKKANLKIIIELKKFLFEAEGNLKSLFVKKNIYFTRERKITFVVLILYLINTKKKTLSLELVEFFSAFNSEDKIKCSKSAFSQQRIKLDHSFFYVWNDVQKKSFYKHYKNNVKRWKGHLLIAYDGTTLYLFDKEEILDYFGTQSNQHVERPMARVMFGHDVLNDITINAHICPIRHAEQKVIPNWISRQEADAIGLYDRNFMSFLNIYINIYHDKKFVIRSPVGFNNEIKAFVSSGKQSMVVEIPSNYNAIKRLKLHGYNVSINDTVKVRLIRIELPTGEIEVLATNLFDTKKYPYKCFKDLYFKRWKLETVIGIKKNLMQIEIFSGHSVEAVKQDFYATIFVYNLQSILMKSCEKIIKEKTKNRKYKYKLNRNVTFGLLKNKILKIFLSSSPKEIIKELAEDFIDNLEPIRPNRKYERKTKKMRLNGKHQTLTNYKRAI